MLFSNGNRANDSHESIAFRCFVGLGALGLVGWLYWSALVEENRFGSVGLALLPIILLYISARALTPSKKLWDDEVESYTILLGTALFCAFVAVRCFYAKNAIVAGGMFSFFAMLLLGGMIIRFFNRRRRS